MDTIFHSESVVSGEDGGTVRLGDNALFVSVRFVAHVVPVNPAQQAHVHAVLPAFEVSDRALPLQCVAEVHWVHAGYAM